MTDNKPPMTTDKSAFAKWQRAAAAKVAAAKAAERKAAAERLRAERAAANNAKRDAKRARAEQRKTERAAAAMSDADTARTRKGEFIAAVRAALKTAAPRVALLEGGDIPIAWNIAPADKDGKRRAVCASCRPPVCVLAFDSDFIAAAARANWHLLTEDGGKMICPKCGGKSVPKTRGWQLRTFGAAIIPAREILEYGAKKCVSDRLKLLAGIE